MGAGGVPNRAVVKIYGRSGDLPTEGAVPNSRYDLFVEDEHIQSRWFDENGNVIRNRDFIHQDTHHNHFFPHDHRWYKLGSVFKRDPENLTPDYLNYY